MAKNRIALVDAAKGLSITLVALGHSHLVEQLGDVNNVLSTFRMPFFFFLSGLFFNAMRPFSATVLRKADSLLKPYAVTLVLLAVAQAMSGERSYIGEYSGILWGTATTIQWAPLWFLPHLWLVFVYAYAFNRVSTYFDWSRHTQIIVQCIALAAGIAAISAFRSLPFTFLSYRSNAVGLPFSADIVPISGFFFFFGSTLRQHAFEFKPKAVPVVLAAVIFLSATGYFGAYLDLAGRYYSPAVATTVAAVTGIYLALSLSYALKQFRWTEAWFCYIGSMSLFVLLFHSFIETKVYALLNSVTSGSGLGISILALIAAVAIPAAMGHIIRRIRILSLLYVPFPGNSLANKWANVLLPSRRKQSIHDAGY